MTAGLAVNPFATASAGDVGSPFGALHDAAATPVARPVSAGATPENIDGPGNLKVGSSLTRVAVCQDASFRLCGVCVSAARSSVRASDCPSTCCVAAG